MVSNNFIMHIVSATTAIISLILLMASVYYGLYEQWIYVAICIVAILLDFYIHMLLVNKIIIRCDCIQSKSKKTPNLIF